MLKDPTQLVLVFDPKSQAVVDSCREVAAGSKAQFFQLSSWANASISDTVGSVFVFCVLDKMQLDQIFASKIPLQQAVKLGTHRTVVMSGLFLTAAQQAELQKAGFAEVVPFTISPKSLRFKLERQLLLLAQSLVNFRDRNPMAYDSGAETIAVVREDPQVLVETDFWHYNPQHTVKKSGSLWKIAIQGPLPIHGRFKEDGRSWVWVPSPNPQDFLVPADTRYIFHGECPEFDPKTRAWILISTNPLFERDCNGVRDWKLKLVNNDTLWVRKNSKFSNDLILRREGQLGVSKPAPVKTLEIPTVEKTAELSIGTVGSPVHFVPRPNNSVDLNFDELNGLVQMVADEKILVEFWSLGQKSILHANLDAFDRSAGRYKLSSPSGAWSQMSLEKPCARFISDNQIVVFSMSEPLSLLQPNIDLREVSRALRYPSKRLLRGADLQVTGLDAVEIHAIGFGAIRARARLTQSVSKVEWQMHHETEALLQIKGKMIRLSLRAIWCREKNSSQAIVELGLMIRDVQGVTREEFSELIASMLTHDAQKKKTENTVSA